MSKQKIVVMGTGGTIAGRATQSGDNIGYRAGEVAVADLLTGLQLPPEALGDTEVEPLQIAQVDSKDMGPAVWGPLLLALEACLADPQVRSVVITHGTDTIEETAFLLGCLIAPLKPVVLTCAMRPASALAPDGPQNMRDALSVAMDPLAVGVHVVAAGWVHAAMHVTKVHPYRVDAFSSGELGPSACVEEGCVRWLWKYKENMPFGLDGRALSAIRKYLVDGQSWPRVEIVLSHAGACGDGVDAWMLQSGGPRPVRGLVVACTGNGTIHADLQQALARAQAAGVAVWKTTRCSLGQVIHAAMPLALSVSGAWPAVPFSPVKARLALMLMLMSAEMA